MVSEEADCERASKFIDSLLVTLGLSPQDFKGDWYSGSHLFENLGVMVDTKAMTFLVVPRKCTAILQMSKILIHTASRGRRFYPMQIICNFCRKCVSLPLALPWSQFHIRDLYHNLSDGKSDGSGLVDTQHVGSMPWNSWPLMRPGLLGLARKNSVHQSVRAFGNP